MASSNFRLPCRHDSSSGSDEADSGHQAQVQPEIHYKKDCGYRRFQLGIGGRRVYIWLRSCVCGQYKSFDIQKGVTDLEKEEGKDFHLSAECRWRKQRRDTRMGECWELKKKCLDCTRPKTASHTGNYSKTWAAFPNKNDN